MRIFKGKAEKELDSIIQRLEMDMSNNYKDNAQDDLKEFGNRLDSMRSSGMIKGKKLLKYEAILAGYREKMQGYSHKEQKPYWT